MNIHLLILITLLVSACSNSARKPPIKFVNHSILAEHSNAAFIKDSSYCFSNSTRNRPVIYEDCRASTSNPAMRKNCSRDNKRALQSYKKLTKKLVKKCLSKKGWKEEIIAPISIIEKTDPIYPNEAALLCIEGKVTLTFNIQKDGSVKGIEVLEASPKDVFNKAAINAVSKWRFKLSPGSSQKEEIKAMQTIHFILDKPCCNNPESTDNDCKGEKNGAGLAIPFIV